jgi:glycosyltransferase involved in cell wall biosynthesis
MIRLIQLTPASPDFQTRRSLEHLAIGLGENFQITRLSIGPGGDARNAFLAGMRLRRQPPAHLIHAWGLSPLAAAVFGAAPRIIYSPDPHTEPKMDRWLRAAVRKSNLQIVCPNEFTLRQFSRIGLPPEKCRIIPPAFEFDRVAQFPNTSLRSRLGLSESDFVVLSPGESTRSANHRLALWSASILHVMDQRFRILLEGCGPQMQLLERFAQRVQQPNLLTIAPKRLGQEIDLETLASAADVAIVTAEGNFPTLPVVVSMAAGLPIVCGASSAPAEILESDQSALLLPQITPRAFAQSIWQLWREPNPRQNLGQAARIVAQNFASPAQFSDRCKSLYEKIANLHPAAC